MITTQYGQLLAYPRVPVVRLDIAHGDAGELLVARLHLADDRLQRADDLVHVDDDFVKARCGMPAKAESSTRFGSIITNRTSSGVACIMMPAMMAFMQTLLPVPVAPAMSRCGIFRQVRDDGVSRDALAQGERQFRLDRQIAEFLRFHDVAHRHDGRAVVGHLDSDNGAARYRRLDTQAWRRQRQSQVVLERGDLVHSDARPRHLHALGARAAVGRHECATAFVLQLELFVAHFPARLDAELRHGRAFVDLHDGGVDSEARERVHDELRPGGVVVFAGGADLRSVQHFDRGELPAAVLVHREHQLLRLAIVD